MTRARNCCAAAICGMRSRSTASCEIGWAVKLASVEIQQWCRGCVLQSKPGELVEIYVASGEDRTDSLYARRQLAKQRCRSRYCAAGLDQNLHPRQQKLHRSAD